ILGQGQRQSIPIVAAARPTAEWIARQLIEACAWDRAPRYVVRDRDSVYGPVFMRRLRAMGIRDRPTAPRSPWQNGHSERLIGSIRRECLDYVVVFGERHLRHVLASYAAYYNQTRTHLSLNKDAPPYPDYWPHPSTPHRGGIPSSLRPDLVPDGETPVSRAVRHQQADVIGHAVVGRGMGPPMPQIFHLDALGHDENASHCGALP